MGIYSRDYYREDRPGGFGASFSGEWAIKFLLIANIAVFVLQQIKPDVASWFDLRLAMQIGSEGAPFYEVPIRGDRLPARLPVPTAEIAPNRQLEAGAGVQVKGHYGSYALVRWRDRYGLVPSDSLRVAPLRSWQLCWRLLTYGFLHGGLMHIAFNMYVLWLFGRMLEPIYGSREFLAIYLVGVAVSGLFHVLFQVFQGTAAAAIGASGGVMAVTFLCAMHYPRMKLLLMFVFPIEMRWLAVMYAVVDVLGLANPASGVAHAAHLGGAAFGVAYKYYGWRLIPFWDRLLSGATSWARWPRRPKVRIYEPSEEMLSARVDALLEKIYEQGEASLTDEERRFLKEASRRFKRR